jgi:hypothetical protein
MALHRRLCLTPDTMKGELRESLTGAVEGALHPNFAVTRARCGRGVLRDIFGFPRAQA